MSTSRKRHQPSHDHRLKELVRTTGNPDIVAVFGVPRSTAIGWLRGDYQPVVSGNVLDRDHVELQAEVLALRQRIRKLASVIRLLLALVYDGAVVSRACEADLGRAGRTVNV